MHVNPSARSTLVKFGCMDESVTFAHETMNGLESGTAKPSVQFGPRELMKDVFPTRLPYVEFKKG